MNGSVRIGSFSACQQRCETGGTSLGLDTDPFRTYAFSV
jgi:hypothetical protein